MAYNGLIKKSRTLDLAAFEGVYGAMIAAAPAALSGLSAAPIITDESQLPMLILYYGTIGVGVSKIVLAGVHAVLRYKTTGKVGEK